MDPAAFLSGWGTFPEEERMELSCRQGNTLEGVRDSSIVSGSVLPWLCHYGSS